MTRTTSTILALAMLAATGSAFASAQDYRNDPRNDPRYDNNSQWGREGPNSRYNDTAQVIRVTRMRDVNPYASYQRQQCWNEQSNNYQDGYYRDRDGRLYRENQQGNNNSGAVIGAVVGGLLGNQIGDGDGRTAATIAGAAAGAAIGNNMDNNRDDRERRYGDYNYSYRDNTGYVHRCRTVGDYGDSRDNRGYGGYNVTYRYAGRTYQTMTREHPGRSIQVVVDVRPRNQGTAYRN